MSHPKERRLKTYPNRYGEGKVHRMLYSSLNRIWYVSCRGLGGLLFHGEEVDSSTPVTCKKCL